MRLAGWAICLLLGGGVIWAQDAPISPTTEPKPQPSRRPLAEEAPAILPPARPEKAQGETPAQPSVAELLDQVKKLEGKLDTLSRRIDDPTSPISQDTPVVVPDETSSVLGFKPIEHRYAIGSTPVGGGGYFWLASQKSDFTLGIQNQFTADGTFANRPVQTAEEGFNIPFYRLYMFGDITKGIGYQAAVQSSLGSFNILDLFMDFKVSKELNFRVGKFLSPFLYEYYGWSPALEPVLTNSVVFQIGGKRQVGAMAFGNLAEERLQYMAGVFNGIEGGFYDLDHSVTFLGAATLTPFKNTGWEAAEGFGMGFGSSAGNGNYLLSAGNANNFINGAGEPTLNQNWITSTGVPFFEYAGNVAANGMQTKFAPHLFWFGRFSVTAEYAIFNRELTNGIDSGISTTRGMYVNASYFLTGERHFAGNGFQGYSTVEPNSPFMPRDGLWGPGAWELATQYSNLSIDGRDITRGFSVQGQSPNQATAVDQLMVGINWWPNRFTRMSFDAVFDKFNAPTTMPTGNEALQAFNTYWVRWSAFF